MNTPGNKRKSDVGTGPKGSAKKRKSNVNGSADVSFDVKSSPKVAETPSKKKMQKFAGTATIASANNTPKGKKSQQANSVSPGVNKENSPDKKNAKKINISSQNTEITPNKKPNMGKQKGGQTEGSSPNKKQKKDKKPKISNEIVEKFSKRKRRTFLSNLKTRLDKEPNDTLAAQIQERIDILQKRSELSKSAKRKLGRLQHFLLKAKGIAPETSDKKTEAKSKKQNKKEKANKKATPEAPKAAALKGKKAEAKPVTEDDDEFEESSSEEEATLQNNSILGLEAGSDEEEEDDEANANEEEADSSGDDDDEADASDDENDAAAESDDEEDEAEDGEEEQDESEGESDEEETPAAKKSKIDSQKKQPANKTNENVNNKKSNENAASKQKQRYVLFIGNLPYDATESEISAHFEKAGKILSVRVPRDKTNNKPRGFGYVEVGDEVTYQKAFSMHQTFLKGRQLKVEYTKGGNKNSEFAKKEIKAKNAKLHALRKGGKLAGAKKENQKRSFRRKNAGQNNGKAGNM